MALKYAADHSEHADKDVTATSAHILAYDTRTEAVAHLAELGEGADILAVKGAIVNMIESHLSDYSSTIGRLVEESDKAKRRLRQGRPLLDPNSGMGLIGRAGNRAENAFARLASWDGVSDFEVMLPYAEVIVGTPNNPDVIDLDSAKPYLNGIMFVARMGPR